MPKFHPLFVQRPTIGLRSINARILDLPFWIDPDHKERGLRILDGKFWIC
jgi:hypothetical protein